MAVALDALEVSVGNCTVFPVDLRRATALTLATILLGGLAVVGSSGNVPFELSLGYSFAAATALTTLAGVAYQRRKIFARFGVVGTAALLLLIWIAVFAAAFTSVDYRTN